MKYIISSLLFSTLLFISCGPSKAEIEAREKCRQDELTAEELIREKLISTFDNPFPKRNRNLARILGDTLQIEGTCVTSSLQIISTRKYNLIINIETGDTLFKGTVCKYRDLYYCNEQLNDSSYRIFALKITDSLIYGLQNYLQYSQIDSAIQKGYYPKLVKYNDSDKKLIRLQPDKKELRKLFTSILQNTRPFPIFKQNTAQTTNYIEELVTPIESGDYDFLSKIYPNPATDIINIELQQKNKFTFQLTNISGTVVLKGQLTEIENKIDIREQPTGIYNLTIINQVDGRSETVKIVKHNNTVANSKQYPMAGEVRKENLLLL